MQGQIASLTERVVAVNRTASEQAAKLVAGNLRMLTSIIEVQSKELALFRELEHHTVSQTLTEQLLQDILNRLNTLRAEAAQAVRTAQAAVAAKASS